MSTLANLWQYRYFVVGSIVREFQSRYRNSLLGLALVVLPPAAQIAVYTIVFSRLMGARLPGIGDGLAYSIYLCAGFVAWGLFTDIVTRNLSVFLDNANMVKKLVFPRICLPATVLGSAVINFLIISVIFWIFLAAIGRLPRANIIAVLPLVAIQLLLSLGLGLSLGILNVFVRDVGQLTHIVLQFWFWLTPIVYPIAILPDSVRALVSLNPMTPVVTAYQQIFVYQAWPEWNTLGFPLALGLGLTLLAFWVYRRTASYLVDEL
ncbi:ABC transporter permease [Gilvimarinus sp. F26214L]|uniref:ABC transporter permease n=1 Tax=Gilvimarinus sp. DZF01 TaxID=3461371 RepID=UPI004046081C